MTEMELFLVKDNPNALSRVVLRQKGGDTYLQIPIGFVEAQAIALAHNHKSPPRPLTYDLICSVLAEIDGRISQVEITEFHLGIFRAEVRVDRADGSQTAYDSRSSDAIALALRAGAPIFVDDAILAAEGEVRPEQEEELEDGEAPFPQREESQAEELARRLKQAVAEEAYEEAARLRDEIDRLDSP